MALLWGLLVLLMLAPSSRGGAAIAQGIDEQQSAAPADLQMQLRSATGSNRFQIGELIPLKVSLSSSTAGRYLAPCALFNESTFGYPLCRFLSTWSFAISPKEGWVQSWDDPRMAMHSGPMYKIPSHDLTAQPEKSSYVLTDRFRFDKPGEYHVRLSIEVGLDDETTKDETSRDPRAKPHSESISQEIVLEIVPAAADWEREVIRKGYQAYLKPVAHGPTFTRVPGK